MKPYFVTFRAIIYAPSEVDAISWAEETADAARATLIPEDGDDFYVTQITPYNAEITPQETVTTLRLARNVLIRTRYKDCYEVAQQIDKFAHELERRTDENSKGVTYDWTRFMEIAKEILDGGAGPIHK